MTNTFGLLVVVKMAGTGLLKEDENMLWTVVTILLVLWRLGLVTSYTLADNGTA